MLKLPTNQSIFLFDFNRWDENPTPAFHEHPTLQTVLWFYLD